MTTENKNDRETIMDENKIYVLKGSKSSTPHKIAPKPEKIFEDFDEDYREKIFPLLQIDLHAINPDFQVKIFAIYYESSNIDWVEYSLNAEGKITDLAMTDLNGEQVDIAGDEVEELSEGYEGMREEFNERTKYAAILTAPFPEEYVAGTPDKKGDYDLADYEGTNKLKLGEKWQNRYKYYLHKTQQKHFPKDDTQSFGPLPVPGESNFSVPGDGYLFAGMIVANEEPFELDATFFLFYNPETRKVSQLMQMG